MRQAVPRGSVLPGVRQGVAVGQLPGDGRVRLVRLLGALRVRRARQDGDGGAGEGRRGRLPLPAVQGQG